MPQISDLNIDCSELEFPHNVRFCEKLSIFMYANKHLDSVSISGLKIDDTCARHLIQALTKKCNISSLHLLSCEFGHGVLQTLALALTNNTSLQQLNLSGSQIEDRGLKALLANLRDYAYLKHLVLLNCGITENGMSSLYAALLDGRLPNGLQRIEIFPRNDLQYLSAERPKLIRALAAFNNDYRRKIQDLHQFTTPFLLGIKQPIKMQVYFSIAAMQVQLASCKRRSMPPEILKCIIEMLGPRREKLLIPHHDEFLNFSANLRAGYGKLRL